jgi:hypothetical protein
MMEQTVLMKVHLKEKASYEEMKPHQERIMAIIKAGLQGIKAVVEQQEVHDE